MNFFFVQDVCDKNITQREKGKIEFTHAHTLFHMCFILGPKFCNLLGCARCIDLSLPAPSVSIAPVRIQLAGES